MSSSQGSAGLLCGAASIKHLFTLTYMFTCRRLCTISNMTVTFDVMHQNYLKGNSHLSTQLNSQVSRQVKVKKQDVKHDMRPN